MPTTPLCTDVDLLHWEPTLPRDAAFASQTLLAGTGTLSNTSFTIAAGSLAVANVVSNQVIVINGSVNGCFPIASIESPTELKLSVLYDQLQPDMPGAALRAAAPAASDVPDVPYSIRTFWPQRSIVTELLYQAAGVGNARPGETQATITNLDALKRVCTLGTLQMIYNALAVTSDDTAHYQVRADLYEKLYRRALRAAKVDIDLDGDGFPEVTRALNVLGLQRV